MRIGACDCCNAQDVEISFGELAGLETWYCTDGCKPNRCFIASEGQRVTTRYFGGYESVRVLQVHPTYYVVSRFGAQASDILPKDRIAKAFDADGNEVFCSSTEAGLHPEVAAIARRLARR